MTTIVTNKPEPGTCRIIGKIKKPGMTEEEVKQSYKVYIKNYHQKYRLRKQLQTFKMKFCLQDATDWHQDKIQQVRQQYIDEVIKLAAKYNITAAIFEPAKPTKKKKQKEEELPDLETPLSTDFDSTPTVQAAPQ